MSRELIRDIPFPVRILCYFSNTGVQLGSIVFCVCLAAILYSDFLKAAAYFVHFQQELTTIEGTVVQSGTTGTAVDYEPDEEDGRSEDFGLNYATQYRFEVGGKMYSGISYSTEGAPAKGDRVSVEYVKDNPEVSRIVNFRSTDLDERTILFYVFLLPVALYVVVVSALQAGRKKMAILRSETDPQALAETLYYLPNDVEVGESKRITIGLRSYLMAGLVLLFPLLSLGGPLLFLIYSGK